jgi:hypothetical protein
MGAQVAMECDTGGFQVGLDRPLLRCRPGLETAARMDRACLQFFRYLGDNPARIAAPQQQSSAARLDVMAKGLQGVMQPPAAGAPHRPVFRHPIVQHVDQGAPIVGACGSQARVIAKP